MSYKDLKEQYKNRDRVVRVLSKDGKIRAVAAKITRAAITAQEKHKLSFVPAFLLARHLTAATMMASFLKGEERVIIETESNGPINRIYAEAMQVGEIRGFIEQDSKIDPATMTNIGDAVGPGFLKVTKTLYNKSEPLQGIVVLQKGDLTTDLAYYFVQSEQIPTAVIVDVDIDDDGKIIQAAGLLVQAMPGASKDDIKKVYDSLINVSPVTKLFNDGKYIDEVLSEILPFEYDKMNSSQIDFFCRCSKERFIDKLKLIGLEEIEDMQKEGQNSLVCRYCNTHYELEKSDFDSLLEELQANQN